MVEEDLDLLLNRLGKSNDINNAEKARAFLKVYREYLDNMSDPLIRLTEQSLEQIAKQGGKMDSSIFSALCLLDHQAENTVNVLEARQMAGHKKSYDGAETIQTDITHFRKLKDLAHELADHMVGANMVDLPVVARGRGRG